MRGRKVRFSHNLHTLFPSEVYSKTHPDFFPVIDGIRYFPPDDKPADYQPCFSAPGLVEEAVKRINQYFLVHTEETWFSLGVNDSGKWCESDLDSVAERKKNYRGYWDFSDVYFRWANAVVKEPEVMCHNQVVIMFSQQPPPGAEDVERLE